MRNATSQRAGSQEVRGALRDELASTAPARRAARLESWLASRIADALGLPAETAIDHQRPLVDLGVDSLIALELRAQLEDGLRVDLQPTAVFDHPTLAELARALLDSAGLPGPVAARAKPRSLPSSSRWLVVPSPLASPRARLFCLSHAGGSASSYHAWASQLPDGVELNAVQLPGRGSRYHEPAIRSLAALVEMLLPLIRDRAEAPYALFGHSMGAIVAVSLARAALGAGVPLPRIVLVSASRPPERITDQPHPDQCSDQELLQEVQRYGGLPDAVANDAELIALIMPALRADLEVLATRDTAPGTPLPTPLVALGGRDDRFVSAGDLEAWRPHAGSGFSTHLFDGAHFYLHDDPAPVLAAVGQLLRDAFDDTE
jgi:surfactin synthase thioesterase subunit/acyl carrier protein